MEASVERITIEPGKRGGKPCNRGLRITVWDVLGWLGGGMSEAEILDEHPDLEQADSIAVHQYAAEIRTFRVIEELLRQNAIRISEFEQDQTTGLLALRFQPLPR